GQLANPMTRRHLLGEQGGEGFLIRGLELFGLVGRHSAIIRTPLLDWTRGRSYNRGINAPRGHAPAMPDDDSVHLQALIDHMNRGDADARRELIGRAYDRLRRLAGAMFHRSFPALKDHHDVESVVHDACLRLVQALDSVATPTVADFFRLAGRKVHQV